jgi:hypothetical protein
MNKKLESLLILSMIDLARNHPNTLNEFLTDIGHGIEDTGFDKKTVREARKRAQEVLVESLESYHQTNHPEFYLGGA